MDNLVEIVGWLPAFVFPAATGIQLVAVLRSKNVTGVSPVTWSLFGLANLSLYVFAEKYTSPQAIVGMVGTAVMDFVLVGYILYKKAIARSEYRAFGSNNA